MASLPLVAIVGRPNTGKSTLFNRIIGKRVAIVSDIPGTTRDHICHRVDSESVDYLLIDTGGMGGGTEDTDFESDVEAQSRLAIEHADAIVLVLSGKDELTSADHAVAGVLRKRKRKHVPVIVALNKIDNPAKVDEILPAYYELGIGETMIPISAAHGSGFGALEDAIEEALMSLHFGKQPESILGAPRIAVVGRPNVGKSSMINGLMSDPQRATSPRIVSDIPGTTRDAVDTVVRHKDHDFVFVDTAGIKRKKDMGRGVETLAYLRSMQAIAECDVAVLVLDGTGPITRQDKRIAQLAMQEGKGLIIAVNKSDGMMLEQKKNAIADVQQTMLFCRFASVILCSSKTREGLPKLFDLIETVERNRVRRIPTKDLHEWFSSVVRGQPMDELARSKHITQADGVPPTFVVFVKDPKRVKTSELKYLERRLRETFAFEGTSIRWITKSGSR